MSSSERSTSSGELSRATITFVIALLLGGLATGFWMVGGRVFAWAALVPGLFALLLLYSAVHFLFASRNPPTTLRLDAPQFARGQPLVAVIRQQGPIEMQSLRANLVCERTGRSKINARQNRGHVVTFPYQINVFETGRFSVGRIDSREFPVNVTVPAEGEPTTDTAELQVRWRIEVWGKVEGRADFMRPFDITVV